MTDAQARSEVGVFTTDTNLVIGKWDVWMSRASGISEEKARGRPLLELFPDIESRHLVPRLRAVLEHGTVEVLAPAFHQYLIKCPTVDGNDYFDVMQQHVSVSPLREHGAITGLIITIEDVTARCVRERELALQLKNENDAIRLRAARQLTTPEGAGALVGALGDESWQVRRTAVAGLVHHPNTDAIAQLIEIVRDKHTDLATLNASLSALTLAKRDSLPLMLGLLDSQDANVRMYTALALGNMQDPRALPALLPLLSDADLNVRYHVIEALGRIGSSTAVEPLLNIVRERDSYLSFAALDALAAIGEPSAMPEVIALIDEPTLQAAAVDTLGAVGNEQAAAPLASILPTTPAPTAVCNALARIHARLEREYGEGELVEDLVRARIDAASASRLVSCIPEATDNELPGVARVLGWLRFEGVEGALCGLLEHAPSRRNAQESLVALGKRALPGLIAELKHDSPEVRQAAAAVLGRIGDESAVPHLSALLAGDEAEVLVTVTAALGSIGSPAAFEALLPLLAHTDVAVRHAAVSAINSIAHPDTARRIRTMLADRDSLIRECAVKIAGYFGFRDCFEPTLNLLNDESAHVRRAVVEHLPYFEDPRNVNALARALSDREAGVRAAAGRALSHLSAEQADSLLDVALADADPRVRYQAVQAIGTHRLRRFAAALRNALTQDPAMPVRIASATALGLLADPDAADVLKNAAAHPEADLACPAITALGRIPRADIRGVIEIALGGDDPRRQLAAVEAVASHTEFWPQLKRVAATAEDPRVLSASLTALVGSGEPEAIEFVIGLCAREDRRTECMNALAHASADDTAQIATGLRHRDARVRWAVVQALARMRRKSASRELSTALDDVDPNVRFAAAQALGRLDMLADHQGTDAPPARNTGP